MAIKRRDVFILVLVLIGLLFFAMLPASNDRWSVASAQTQPPTPTPTTPNVPRDVPEADTLLLFAGGLSGLGTWLGWKRYQIRKIK
jgi:hypothetical protein